MQKYHIKERERGAPVPPGPTLYPSRQIIHNHGTSLILSNVIFFLVFVFWLERWSLDYNFEHLSANVLEERQCADKAAGTGSLLT